ncbi:MAG TPA: hypothetical protein VHT97_03340 [Acidimicrobiales bacterium]|nr:hypothetical protein [Acidimicrobiales bacterium]
MDVADYDLWVDDHTIDDDGNIVTLAKYARAGVEPEVGKVFLVGDGEQTPFRARVLQRTDEGLVVLRALDDPANALPA